MVAIDKTGAGDPRVEGRVFRSDTNADFSGLEMSLQVPGGGSNAPPLMKTTTGGDGRFSFVGMPAGRYSVGTSTTFRDVSTAACKPSVSAMPGPGVPSMLFTLHVRLTRDKLGALLARREDGLWVMSVSTDPFDVAAGDRVTVNLDMVCP